MEKIAVVDFGGQYTHLIANRIRRLGVYSEIVQNDVKASELSHYKGVIFSGGPHSVFEEDSPKVDPEILNLGLPILGLCYGHQLISQLLGGEVHPGNQREYGLAQLEVSTDSDLFRGLDNLEQIWMSHGDAVEVLPEGFTVIGSTPDCTAAAVEHKEKHIYGMQFHPEVTDSIHGMKMLENYLDICKCAKDWTSDSFVAELSEQVRKECEGKKVFLLVSGGVDSTVAFALLNKVLGPERVLGVHIDNGLMRKNESEDIMDYMKRHGFDNLHIYNGTDDFLKPLFGHAEPEKKREIIGNKFIDCKDIVQEKFNLNIDEWLLAQGTIYPDTIESAGTKHAAKIKTHHNRVDVILELIEKGLIVEPLAMLYKDEVRALGEALDIPHDLVWRHPFPGPGLGVRVLCSDGNESPVAEDTVKETQEIAAKYGFKAEVLPVKSVGVQGDSRTYSHPAVVYGDLDWDALEQASTTITNTITEVNRVVYAVSHQSPANFQVVEGYLTEDRLDKLREIDDVVTKAVRKHGEYDTIWQMPVVLLPMVDEEGNEAIVLRPITSQEAMTARFYPLKKEILDEIVAAAKEIDGLGPIFFDISHKPPGTIEWE